MKIHLLLGTLFIAIAAFADTPPITNVYKLNAPGGNGLIVSTGGKPALVTTTTPGYVATWNGTTVDFEAGGGGGGGVSTMGAFGSAPNSNGGTITGPTLVLQPADATHPGGVSTGSQTIAGQKTVQSQSAANVPLVVQGAGSQSGDLLQLKDSSSSVLSAFSSTGGLLLGTDTQVSPPAAAIIAQNANTDSGLLFKDINGHYMSIEVHPQHFIIEGYGSNPLAWWNGPLAPTNPNWQGFGPGTHNPVYPLDFNFPTNAVTNVTSISSITPNNGVLYPPVMMVENLNTTAGTIAGYCTGGQSQYPMSCIASHHSTNPSSHGTEASTVEFANQNSGTMTDYMNVSATQQIQFNAYGVGLATFDSSGHISSSNLSGPITSTGSVTSVASQTGTGSTFVMQASPTLTTPNLGTPTALVGTNITGTASGLTAGSVTTNANLTGVITSVGNTTSIASQTGTGTKFVVDTSPTLVTPAIGAATATSVGVVAAAGTNTAGTALAVSGGQGTGTGKGGAVTFSTSLAGSTGTSVNALTQIAQVGTAGVGIFSTANDVALHVKQQGADDTGIILEDTNNTKKLALNAASANQFSMELVGGNYFWTLGNGTSSAAPTNWQGWSDGGANPTLKWPWGYEVSSSNGNVTSFSTYTPANGATVNGYPIAVYVNRNANLNTLMELCTADASFGLTTCFGHRSIDQTTNANKAEVTIANADGSGHAVEHVRVKTKGFVESTGTVFTATCNGNAATGKVGGGNNGRFNAPASPGTSCAITFADTLDNAPICDATDETANAGAGAKMTCVGTSTTVTTCTYSGLTASDLIAFHCGGYF